MERLGTLVDVVSPRGTFVHLALEAALSARDPLTLCRVPVDLATPPHPLELAGCKKCARYAAKRGESHVVTQSGERVELQEVVDRPW